MTSKNSTTTQNLTSVLLGNIGAIREHDGSRIREFDSGAACVRFSVAHNQGRGDEKVTTWYEVTVWKPKSDKAKAWFKNTFGMGFNKFAKSLKVGQRVKVEGKVQERTYKGKVYRNVNADRLQFIAKRTNEEPKASVTPETIPEGSFASSLIALALEVLRQQDLSS